jgi:predicted nucleotidyltransferase
MADPRSTSRSTLEEVLTSPARFRTAKLLVRLPEKEFTGREMARILGLSHSSVQEALEVLVREGLAYQRVVGRAHAYRANKDSYLFKALTKVYRAERDLEEDVRETIRSALEGRVVSAVLFGSRARGTARRASDVDLVVVSKNLREAGEIIARLQTRLLTRYGLGLDAKLLTPTDLRSKARTPYLKAALAEGRLLVGVPLEGVLASAT